MVRDVVLKLATSPTKHVDPYQVKFVPREQWPFHPPKQCLKHKPYPNFEHGLVDEFGITVL